MNGMNNNNNSNSNNFRHRRNFKKSGGGAGGGHRGDRNDFRRQNSHSDNHGSSSGARHPELDIVIDGKAVKKASMMRDKYTALARDAQSSGDRVLAENYNQHADHYNRILIAANELRPQSQRINVSTDGDDSADEAPAAAGNAEPGNSASAEASAAPAMEAAPANTEEESFVAA